MAFLARFPTRQNHIVHHKQHHNKLLFSRVSSSLEIAFSGISYVKCALITGHP